MSKNIVVGFLSILAASIVFIGYNWGTSSLAIAQSSVNIRTTGQFSVNGMPFVRFTDPDTKAVCYMNVNFGTIACIK